MTNPARTHETDVDDRTRWRAFAVAVAVASLTILDVSKVNVGVPAIEDAFGRARPRFRSSSRATFWRSASCLCPPVVTVTRTRVAACSCLGSWSFFLASLLCAIAPTVEVLAGARILQGVAAGLLMPQVFGLVQQLFQGPARGRAFGVFGAVIGLSTAFGPTLGGLFVDLGGADLGWRLIFWMNVPLVLALFPFAVKLLPRHQPVAPGSRDLDLIGAALLGLTVLSLMLPFVLTTGGPDDDPARWTWLIVFAAAGSVFVWWEGRYARSGRTAIVDFALFRITSYRNGTLVAMGFFAAMPATFLTLTLFLQLGQGLAAVFAGMVTIPFALMMALSSYLSGRVVEKYGRGHGRRGLTVVMLGFTLVLVSVLTLRRRSFPGRSARHGGGGPRGRCRDRAEPDPRPGDFRNLRRAWRAQIGQVGQRVGTAVGLSGTSGGVLLDRVRGPGSEGALGVFQDAYSNAGTRSSWASRPSPSRRGRRLACRSRAHDDPR